MLFVDDDDAGSLNGVNSEERVPITMAASPFFAFSRRDVRCH